MKTQLTRPYMKMLHYYLSFLQELNGEASRLSAWFSLKYLDISLGMKLEIVFME